MDDTPLEELLEASEQNEETSPSGAGKKSLIKKILIFAGIGAAAVSAAIAVASVMGSPGESEGEPPPRVADVENQFAPVHAAPPPSQQVLYTVDSLIVNLRDTDARRYLKAGIVLGLKEQRTVQRLQEHRVLLIDRLILLLSSKTIDDIDGLEKKETLKREIRDDVNTLVGIRDAVTNVYFTELIIQ